MTRILAMCRRRARPAVLSALLGLAACACSQDPHESLARARELGADGERAAAVDILDALLARDAGNYAARTLRAELALLGGDAAQAEADLRRARTDGAPDAEIQLSLGQALLAQGAFQQLVAEIPQRAGTRRRSAQLLVLHGRAYLALAAHADATRAFDSALQLDPRCIGAWVGRAQSARAQGRFEEAETQGWQAITLDPGSVAAWRERGVLEFERGRYAEAEEAFERARSNAGAGGWTEDAILATTGLAETLWRESRREAARARLDELGQRVPSHPVLLYLRALFALESGDHDAAGQYAHALVSRHGEYAEAFTLLGLSALERGDASAASALLERAVVLRPRDASARALLARALLASGDAAAGANALLPVAAAASGERQFLTLLGRAQLAAGEADGGIAALAVAGGMPPSLAAPASIPGAEAELVAAMRAQDAADVEARARRLLAQRPDSLIAALGLAQAAAARGAPAEAEALLARARAAHPHASEPALLLAQHASARGDDRGAVALAKHAVSAAPHVAQAHAALGLASLHAGDSVGARRSLRVAVLIEPGDPQLRIDYAAALLAADDARALAALTAAARMPRVDAARMMRLIVGERTKGRATEAKLLLRELARLQPVSAAAHAAEGDLHLIDERWQAAEDAYGEAASRAGTRVLALKSFIARRGAGAPEPAKPLARWLAQHPDDRSVRLALAHACAERGQHASARRHYERVLYAEPGNAIAMQALIALRRSAGDTDAIAGEGC
jgi:predicted Zn-dependent protease